MTSARIRPAHYGDADTLHELLCRTRREAFGGSAPEEAFEQAEREGLAEWQEALGEGTHQSAWLAHRDGEAVGLARSRATGIEGPRPLCLENLYVLSSEQGQGTGTHLLELAIGDAPCYLWVAAGNDRAVGFYRHHGFEFDGEEWTDEQWPGLTLYRMVR